MQPVFRHIELSRFRYLGKVEIGYAMSLFAKKRIFIAAIHRPAFVKLSKHRLNFFDFTTRSQGGYTLSILSHYILV